MHAKARGKKAAKQTSGYRYGRQNGAGRWELEEEEEEEEEEKKEIRR